jgi:hypothetical protein
MNDRKCKSNVVSQSVARNTTVEQLQRGGKTFPTMGWMQFQPHKILRQFFIRLSVPAKCSNVCFYLNSLKLSSWELLLVEFSIYPFCMIFFYTCGFEINICSVQNSMLFRVDFGLIAVSNLHMWCWNFTCCFRTTLQISEITHCHVGKTGNFLCCFPFSFMLFQNSLVVWCKPGWGKKYRF